VTIIVAGKPHPNPTTPRRTNWLALNALLSALALAGAGCSSTDNRPYPWFQRLEVVSATASTETPPAQTSGDLVGTGSAVGVAGSVGAGLIVSLLCGPWYFECAAQMVPDMAAAGAATGTIDGLAGLSREEADRVNTYFMSLPVRRNLNSEMVSAVEALMPPERHANGSADARLTLGIAQIRILQDISSTFSLRLDLAAQLEWSRGGKQPETATRRFECNTEKHAVANWLADNGRALDQAIATCIDSFARQVFTTLQTGQVAQKGVTKRGQNPFSPT